MFSVKQKTYSLDELAWLSRCLFPNDFKRELIEMGVEAQTAYYLSMLVNLQDGRSRNILELYQECITCNELTTILDEYCSWWLIEKRK